MRLEYEGLSKCEAVSTKGARWYNDPAGFAMEGSGGRTQRQRQISKI